MPIGLHRELAQAAAAQRVSMNQLVCIALAGALGRMSDDPPTANFGADRFHGMAQITDFDSIMRSMGYDDEE